MHIHKWWTTPRPPTPVLQEKQGSYFLWLQAGFRSLCPLIYQRTAVLRLCDDQSPLPSVSLDQSQLYLSLFSCIFLLQSPSSLIHSLQTSSLLDQRSQSACCIFPSFGPNSPPPACPPPTLGLVVFCLCTLKLEKAQSIKPNSPWYCSLYFMILAVNAITI